MPRYRAVPVLLSAGERRTLKKRARRAKTEVRERRADQACSNLDCAHRRCWIEEAHVTELTPLLRDGPAGDQLAGWPGSMRMFARRERPRSWC